MSDHVLPDGVFPVLYGEGDLDRPFWEGVRREQILIQRCSRCRRFQWAPDVICHHCHGFELGFEEVAPFGTVYSWQRTHHAIRPELAAFVPYTVLVVELDEAPGILLFGNVALEPGAGPEEAAARRRLDVPIGARVRAVFEHHDDYSLVQWSPVGP